MAEIKRCRRHSSEVCSETFLLWRGDRRVSTNICYSYFSIIEEVDQWFWFVKFKVQCKISSLPPPPCTAQGCLTCFLAADSSGGRNKISIKFQWDASIFSSSFISESFALDPQTRLKLRCQSVLTSHHKLIRHNPNNLNSIISTLLLISLPSSALFTVWNICCRRRNESFYRHISGSSLTPRHCENNLLYWQEIKPEYPQHIRRWSY